MNQFLDTNRSRQFCQEIVATCHVRNMPATRLQSEDMFKNTWLWKDSASSSGFYRKGKNLILEHGGRTGGGGGGQGVLTVLTVIGSVVSQAIKISLQVE